MNRCLWGLILVGMALLICLLSPWLDQSMAILPYDSTTRLFYGETHLWCQIIYYGVNFATVALIVLPIILFFRKRKAEPETRKRVSRMLLISYLSLTIGPGLLVNTLLKDNWGRPRPYQVIRDQHSFSLPWQPHFGNKLDNSLPSGHESIGAFIGLPFIAYRRRKLGVTLCGVGAIVVGLVRFLQGGHYLSDIGLAAILVWLVYLLVSCMVDKFFPSLRCSND